MSSEECVSLGVDGWRKMGDSADFLLVRHRKTAPPPSFFFPPDGKKPIIDSYGRSSYKFTPGDKVDIQSSTATGSREGPYIIQAAEGGKYTLCDEYGKTAKDGNSYAEDELALHDEFGG